MDWLIYRIARVAVGLLQRLPLGTVARLGRWGGGLVWYLDGRHRRVTLANLTRCFAPARSAAALRGIARENFRRIGENFASAVKTAALSPEAIGEVLEVVGAERLPPGGPGVRCVAAIGHFGNFEVYASAGSTLPGYRFATTYRALRQPSLNRVMQTLRERSGCLYFERRTEAGALREAMNRGGILVGFLSDQHGGRKGVWGPFLGHECSTTAAPAVFALRYKCPLHPVVCYRVALGRWRIEIGDRIPTLEGGQARSVEDITRDINRALEAAVLRDPANWFWVHKRWKPRGREGGRPASEFTADKPE